MFHCFTSISNQSTIFNRPSQQQFKWKARNKKKTERRKCLSWNRILLNFHFIKWLATYIAVINVFSLWTRTPYALRYFFRKLQQVDRMFVCICFNSSKTISHVPFYIVNFPTFYFDFIHRRFRFQVFSEQIDIFRKSNDNLFFLILRFGKMEF